MKWVCFLIAVGLLCGCHSVDKVQADIQGWWEEQDQHTRSTMLEPLTKEPLDYSLSVADHVTGDERDDAQRFVDFWNRLLPGQIEGYCRARMAKKIRDLQAYDEETRRANEAAAAELMRSTRTLRPVRIWRE